MYQLTADGSLPLPEITHYPLAEAAAAIRRIGGAGHTGKLVLDVPHTGHSRVVVPPSRFLCSGSDGAYIVTGGLGGLGLFLAEKMAVAGCGRIVLTSRSPADRKAQEIVELIRATGADIVVECGDIAAAGTAERLVAAATATGLPSARGAARRGGRRGRHAVQYHRRAHRTRLGAEGVRGVEPAPGDGNAAAGLVLLVLVGGRAGGIAGSGRVRCGQQLARRIHSLASGAGPSGQRYRMGSVGTDRSRARRWPKATASRSLPMRARTLGVNAALRPRVHRLCADPGDAVVDRVCATKPVR